MKQVTTDAVGGAIADLLREKRPVVRNAREVGTRAIYAASVDATDPNNCLVTLSNGQEFTVRILTGDVR